MLSVSRTLSISSLVRNAGFIRQYAAKKDKNWYKGVWEAQRKHLNYVERTETLVKKAHQAELELETVRYLSTIYNFP